MARQQGIIRFTGRLGNTVGYLAKDGKGNSFDASRVLAAQVTNPQTVAQMTQRMKMAPVVNFYRGLRGILDHSWQTVKYGEPSRLFFYSQTLRALSSAGVPYIVKGDKQFVPWSFPISSGSIPVSMAPVIASEIQSSYASSLALKVTDEGDVSDASQETTIAALSAVLKQFLGVNEGMQVTFIFVFENNGAFIPVFHRVIVDTTDENLVYNLGFDVTAVGVDSNSYLMFTDNTNSAAVAPLDCVASGIIVSALVNNTWQRNNASLVIAESLRTLYNSQAAWDNMIQSYRTETNTSSDWYLNGGEDEGGSSTVATVKEVTLTTSLGDKTIAYYKVGATKYAPYYEAVQEQQPTILGYRKGGDMAFTKTGAMNLGSGGFVDDLKAEYLALGYTLCTRAELLAIAPDLTIPE